MLEDLLRSGRVLVDMVKSIGMLVTSISVLNCPIIRDNPLALATFELLLFALRDRLHTHNDFDVVMQCAPVAIERDQDLGLCL